MKAFLPSMLERDHGHIVGMISIVGLAAMPIVAGYSSSKFACYGKTTYTFTIFVRCI